MAHNTLSHGRAFLTLRVSVKNDERMMEGSNTKPRSKERKTFYQRRLDWSKLMEQTRWRVYGSFLQRPETSWLWGGNGTQSSSY